MENKDINAKTTHVKEHLLNSLKVHLDIQKNLERSAKNIKGYLKKA